MRIPDTCPTNKVLNSDPPGTRRDDVEPSKLGELPECSRTCETTDATGDGVLDRVFWKTIVGGPEKNKKKSYLLITSLINSPNIFFEYIFLHYIFFHTSQLQ